MPAALLRNAQKKAIRTGMQPLATVEQLKRQGLAAEAAQQAVHQALLRHFEPFAGSWNGYLNANGWLYDTHRLQQTEQQSFLDQHLPAGFLNAAAEVARNPLAVNKLGPLLAASASMSKQQYGEDAENPNWQMLVRGYGMPEELASAVVSASRVPPWWMIIVVAAMGLIAFSIFILALVDPQNSAFQNESVGGVNFLHYTVLPLLALAMLFGAGYITYDRPRRLKTARECLARFAARCASDSQGNPT